MKGKFDEISQGEWRAEYNGQYWEVRGGELLKPNINVFDFDPPGIDANEKCVGEETKANAEFIAFAGNLAQKYNIEALEQIVIVLKEIDQYLRTKSLEMPVNSEDFNELVNIRTKTIKALKSIEK